MFVLEIICFQILKINILHARVHSVCIILYTNLELNNTSARLLINHTNTIEALAIKLPKIMLKRSVAADGLRNILTLNVCHMDSVHVEYIPDFILYPKEIIISKQSFIKYTVFLILNSLYITYPR